MTHPGRSLMTRKGAIRFPAYIPVTTFGERYPLDRLLQPYLPRLASAVMVSYHYVKQMEQALRLPMLVDSGGFASLFTGSRIVESNGLGVLELSRDDHVETVHPKDVLDVQERVADVAFPLDFPIPPGLSERDARRRLELTIANTRWAFANRRRSDMPLFACVQAWDEASARECARAYTDLPCAGIAIGGLVPRARDRSLVLAIVNAVREEIGDLPLHVFGLGHPQLVADLYQAGVNSVDSSAYVQLAADGRLWSDHEFQLTDPTPTDRMHLALCNLAAASGKALPLSLSGIVFETHALRA